MLDEEREPGLREQRVDALRSKPSKSLRPRSVPRR